MSRGNLRRVSYANIMQKSTLYGKMTTRSLSPLVLAHIIVPHPVEFIYIYIYYAYEYIFRSYKLLFLYLVANSMLHLFSWRFEQPKNVWQVRVDLAVLFLISETWFFNIPSITLKLHLLRLLSQSPLKLVCTTTNTTKTTIDTTTQAKS